MDGNIKELDKLNLEGRKRLTMTGVEVVDEFSEQSIFLSVSGNKVVVKGQGIKITSFNKSSGVLCAEGTFDEIKYNQKKTSFFKRIFK